MKVIDAVFQVLKEAAGPLHCDEITKRILRRGLWSTQGKTPAATAGAAIYKDIKKNGVASRFKKIAPNVFALRSDAFAYSASERRPTQKSVPKDKTPSLKDIDFPAISSGDRRRAKMSALEAAFQVLKEAGEPLHCDEITKRILRQGLWSTRGGTPAATVAARIAEEIKKRSGASRFEKVAPGVFALRGAASASSAPEQFPVGKPAVREKNRTLSFKDAALKILKDSKDREPMYYREIMKKALAEGLLTPEGKTPEASMSAIIGTDIKRCEMRGEQSHFVKHGRGVFGLARWEKYGLDQEIDREIEEHNKKVREELLTILRKIPPQRFEGLISELLVKMGFEDVETTPVSGDGGIDVRGTLVEGDVVRTHMAVQVKRFAKGNNVGTPVVQQVRGSLQTHEQGLVITTSTFSSGARKEAAHPSKSPVGLMDGEQLARLLVEHEVGVKRRPRHLLQLEPEELEGREEERD